jgi:uncharacterized protein YggU (UPF0235/DUF167 family)
MDQPWTRTDSGLRVRVRLKPKSSREAVDGVEVTPEGPVIAARVRAVPSENAANSALERLISTWLGVPKTSVALVGGGRSRLKTVAVKGEGQELERLVSARLTELEK